MNQTFQEHLAACGARIEDDRVIDFGSPEAERASTASGTVLVPLAHLAALRANGTDAASFLHNLFTNDVLGLAPGRAEYNGLCSPKGRMLASFLLWREADAFVLAASRDLEAALLRRLSMYILRSKVSLADAGLVLLGLAGREAEAALARARLPVPAEAMTSASVADATVIRLAPARFQVSVRPPAASALWDALRGLAQPAGEMAWRWLDIRAGLPRIVAATQEQFVPQMVNYELVGGVSFHKGCYPGQEIVARSQYIGKIKRRMYLAHLDEGSPPAPGEHLYSPGLPDQTSGTVVDAAPAPEGGCDLLAVIQTSIAQGADLRLGQPDGPRLRIRTLPYAVS
ncbi:MAG: folate-binding protein YgfZ [Rhodocyclaceae bacterium]